MQLHFNKDKEGQLHLTQEKFLGAEFSDLTLSPMTGRQLLIEKVTFEDCRVSPGTCVITSGVSMSEVRFSNLDCGDALTISSEVRLDRVVVEGTFPPALVVQPEERGLHQSNASAAKDFQLDVSGFMGDVCILGLPADRIQTDADRHAKVRLSWNEQLDWKALGIGPFSFWRIFLKKLAVFEAAEGVFSLPVRTDKHYSEIVEERRRMEAAGICFD
ncbi:hypothetical protein LOC67_09280 [Stieleria sp. JC731]|uniref:hypothetical protein n=1 Tax=Pirellulaceae TaxID=2691357 RepID=UPI001E58C33D|nr:hypothetical protein [Stieleria sp. JC731]MCC9600755.1 hypothetical protein [Stieleria sp. JC731]